VQPDKPQTIKSFVMYGSIENTIERKRNLMYKISPKIFSTWIPKIKKIKTFTIK
jgi:hypothetical protein